MHLTEIPSEIPILSRNWLNYFSYDKRGGRTEEGQKHSHMLLVISWFDFNFGFEKTWSQMHSWRKFQHFLSSCMMHIRVFISELFSDFLSLLLLLSTSLNFGFFTVACVYLFWRQTHSCVSVWFLWVAHVLCVFVANRYRFLFYVCVSV